MIETVTFELFPEVDPPAVVIRSGPWENVRYCYKDLTFKYVDEDGMAKLRFSYDIIEASDEQREILDKDSEHFERLIGNILAHVVKDASSSGPQKE